MAQTHRIAREQLVPRPREEVFDFFARAENLEVITPPFLRFRILTPLPISMGVGTRIEYALRLAGLPIRWRTYISEWQPCERFVDEQESGPYAFWRHVHEFEDRGSSTLIRDQVDYRVPFGSLGRLADRLIVARMLHRIFEYRGEQIRTLFDGGQGLH